jgi:1,4-dihydroxy-6-naphthoate synthase
VQIRLGHSPDPDDAFMFWGLAAGVVDPRGFEFELVAEDIQTLNRWALDGRLDVTALSLHAYPFVQERYILLPHGASMGSGYGPIVVGREPLSLDELRGVEIAIPGRMTTAFLLLRMVLGDFAFREVPFDEILDEVASGRIDAGLVIHEGQLTYGASGLHKAIDLGEWWLLETGLPLPLGVNVARRELGDDTLRELSSVLGQSIRAGLRYRDEAIEYALQYGRGLDRSLAERFVEMYVNELTCDYGEEGRQAVRELLHRADALGAYDAPVRIEFVGS